MTTAEDILQLLSAIELTHDEASEIIRMARSRRRAKVNCHRCGQERVGTLDEFNALMDHWAIVDAMPDVIRNEKIYFCPGCWEGILSK